MDDRANPAPVAIYEESNGIYAGPAGSAHNLQRGGPSPVFGPDPDACVDDPNVEPDHRIL